MQPTIQFGFVVESAPDIEAARRFYVDVLGLEVQRSHPDYVEFEHFALATDEGLGGTGDLELFWVVPDAKAAFDEISHKAEVSLPLTDQPYGTVFGIKDPTGRAVYLLELATSRPSIPAEEGA